MPSMTCWRTCKPWSHGICANRVVRKWMTSAWSQSSPTKWVFFFVQSNDSLSSQGCRRSRVRDRQRLQQSIHVNGSFRRITADGRRLTHSYPRRPKHSSRARRFEFPDGQSILACERGVPGTVLARTKEPPVRRGGSAQLARKVLTQGQCRAKSHLGRNLLNR